MFWKKVLISVGVVVGCSAYAQKDAKMVDLKDGYVRVETGTYTVELPKGWNCGAETPWGARKMDSPKSEGGMGTMTAGPSKATWDELYKTSMFFIMREEKGKATPFKIEKTAQGYEACTFSILDDKGFAKRRYVLLKAKSGKVLALNVRIPTKSAESEMAKHFDRMVRTAKIAE